ncbi:MAG: hypothetical protein GAK30_02003 [Paracidovorax wautersii]|uniref:Uncharacterized protein n=1 Tax=Paracidovorax wautersii TaxID=1177982 RepID=A0A7V8FNW5_9BURK|nr:MAG: hypothetical protein GAK30_02003 [Paracidovorax wautersii]
MTSRVASGQAGAFLALWNSIDSPARQAEYETWHSFEHVPERVGLPGFIAAHRYRALAPQGPHKPAYFTWYELASRQALASPAYRDVVDHPTPWSARMRGALRDFHRLPCDAQGCHGAPTGRYVMALHLHAPLGAAASVAPALAAALKEAVDQGNLLRVQWGQGHAGDDFPLANTGQAGTPNTPSAEWVALLHHLDAPALEAACAALLAKLPPTLQIARASVVHELLTSVRQADLPSPPNGSPHGRQPPRTDWMARFADQP